MLLILATIHSVVLEALVPRGRTLPPKNTVRIPVNICCIVILRLMSVSQQAKKIVT